MPDVKVNRKYKDRLFCFRFGKEECKEDMLSLYNALNETTHKNAEDIAITTIEDFIYIRMKNDVSLLLDGNLSLWEQQSTVNPNMPLRGLMYFGNLYSQYIEVNGLNIYGSTLQKIPTPQYIVFYNGTEDSRAVTELKLSDAFINESNGGFEWTATVYNLNRGKNDRLLEQCRPLSDYMAFINRVRDSQGNGMNIKDAIDTAVESCIRDGIMADFLRKHRAEVINVCLSEFNEEVFVKGIRAEGFESGLAVGEERGEIKGEIKGTAKATINLLKDCGEVPEQLSRLIMEQTDLELVSKWLKIAARAESIEDFEEKTGLVAEI